MRPVLGQGKAVIDFLPFPVIRLIMDRVLADGRHIAAVIRQVMLGISVTLFQVLTDDIGLLIFRFRKGDAVPPPYCLNYALLIFIV